jgi:hypothetical protein
LVQAKERRLKTRRQMEQRATRIAVLKTQAVYEANFSIFLDMKICGNSRAAVMSAMQDY